MADGEGEIVKETPKKRKVGDGTPGPGRPKGLPNKTTSLLKDAILIAATQAGEKLTKDGKNGLVAYLEAQAVENPGPFLTLIGKVLPLQVNHADNEGGKLQPILTIGIEPAPAPQAGRRVPDASH